MTICSICNKISATGVDHIDCMQKRRIDLEELNDKEKLPEKLDISKNNDIHIEIKALLEHLTKEKKEADS